MEVPAKPAPRRRKDAAAAAAAAAKQENDLRERVEAYKRSVEAQEEVGSLTPVPYTYKNRSRLWRFLRRMCDAFLHSDYVTLQALNASRLALMEQKEKATRPPRVIANGTSGSRSISPNMRGSFGPGTDNYLAAVRDISGHSRIL